MLACPSAYAETIERDARGERADDRPAWLEEAPAYQVVDQIGDIEVRRYARSLLAEVTLASPAHESLTIALECFARYVFGRAADDDARMLRSLFRSSPRARQHSRGDWRLRFFIANERSPLDAPKPESQAIRLLLEPERLVAALPYEPQASDEVIRTTRRRLLETVRATRRYELDASSEWSGYDSPFLLPFGARPETLTELREPHAAEAGLIWRLITSPGHRR